MNNRRIKEIKTAQKESLLFREVAQLFLRITLDEQRLHDIFVNSVQLSPDKGVCYVFFYTSKGEESFKERLPILILYKPSLRSAISKSITGRYTPNLQFKFDHGAEKQHKMDDFMDRLKEEGKL